MQSSGIISFTILQNEQFFDATIARVIGPAAGPPAILELLILYRCTFPARSTSMRDILKQSEWIFIKTFSLIQDISNQCHVVIATKFLKKEDNLICFFKEETCNSITNCKFLVANGRLGTIK